jgi:hypothetical protein
MRWLRTFFFGNWRNKGVALFFAVTIWIVAYYSEEQEFSTSVTVSLRAAEQDAQIITRLTVLDQQTSEPNDFKGNVRLVFSGPRKQVDEIRDNPPLWGKTLRVAREQDSYTFNQEDFGFPRDGVEIVSFTPGSVRITQEALQTRPVTNVTRLVLPTSRRDGFDAVSVQLEAEKVEVRGPVSIVGKTEDDAGISLSLPVDMEYRRRYKGFVKFQIRPRSNSMYPEGPPNELIERTVSVIPSGVLLAVNTQATEIPFTADGVRITFGIPPVEEPIRFSDDTADEISVEFYGHKDEIELLKKRYRDAGFSLVVPVPDFDPTEGRPHTFTEDDLLLDGYPGVKIRQHPLRIKERRGAWTYTIVPGKEDEDEK